jgi:hypothetical protein
MTDASLLDWLFAYPWLVPLYGAGIALLAAYLVWSTRKLWSLYQDIRAGWSRWDTYPVPDTRACKHIAGFLAVVSIDLLLVAIYLYLTMGGPAQNPLV